MNKILINNFNNVKEKVPVMVPLINFKRVVEEGKEVGEDDAVPQFGLPEIEGVFCINNYENNMLLYAITRNIRNPWKKFNTKCCIVLFGSDPIQFGFLEEAARELQSPMYTSVQDKFFVGHFESEPKNVFIPTPKTQGTASQAYEKLDALFLIADMGRHLLLHTLSEPGEQTYEAEFSYGHVDEFWIYEKESSLIVPIAPLKIEVEQPERVSNMDQGAQPGSKAAEESNEEGKNVAQTEAGKQRANELLPDFIEYLRRTKNYVSFDEAVGEPHPVAEKVGGYVEHNGTMDTVVPVIFKNVNLACVTQTILSGPDSKQQLNKKTIATQTQNLELERNNYFKRRLQENEQGNCKKKA